MPELPDMALADGAVELIQQSNAARGDINMNHAPVTGRSLAFDEPAFLQPVQQPRNVRGARPGERPNPGSASSAAARPEAGEGCCIAVQSAHDC